jgi:hypothetical protein
MSTPIDPNKAVNFILETAPLFAAAQSQHDHLCEFRKSKKALLMLASAETSAVMREAAAYADPEYLQVLDGIKVAGEEAIALKWKLEAAKLRVEIWRSQEASNRNQDRTMR